MWRAGVVVCGWLAVGALWTPHPLVAQDRAGTITGTVNDAGHYVLPGARIELEPKGPTAVSDPQGRSTIQNVPAGAYTVTVSYVGLLPYVAKLTVGSGETAHVDAVQIGRA